MVPVTSVPHLYAIAYGGDCVGPQRCFFCAAPCGESHPTREYVRDTFTAVDAVARPGSRFVCAGCVLCLRESLDVPLCDGTVKPVTKAAHRMFSWLVTAERVVAASKAHLPWLRETCLAPPAPPWALSIAVSGQKQLLYLGVVNRDPGRCTVTLEGRRIAYHRVDLAAAMADCTRIAGICGRPAMESRPSLSHRFTLHESLGRHGVELADWWESSLGEPVFALASYLCPSKKEQHGSTDDQSAAAAGDDDR